MVGYLDEGTLWLSVINLALGIVVLVCCIIILRYVVKDVLHPAKRSSTKSGIPQKHLAWLKALGITPPQDGHEVDEMEHENNTPE